MRGLLVSIGIGVAVAGCGSSNGSGAGAVHASAVTAGVDGTVVAFAAAHVYFNADNRRTVDAPVTFPAAGLRYRKVTLHLKLSCPTGGCDFWDRLGHLSLVRPAPTAGGDPVELELARFITPYRVGADFTVDVTDLQRVLEGEQTVRLFIDTWVGPGSAYGAGWMVDAAFDFEGGLATPDPYAVIPLWAPQRLVYGDPARPVDATATAEVPADATGVRVRALVTGHGQGNAGNCAEFCQREHTFTIGATPVTRMVWRADCATTAAPGQQGTYQYARAGWCPGAMVAPWIADAPATAGPLAVRYGVASYENTCRPDAASCGGCTLGTGCAYDGSNHTEPGWEQSAVLVLLR
jgi:hypothetical protein